MGLTQLMDITKGFRLSWTQDDYQSFGVNFRFFPSLVGFGGEGRKA